MPQTLAARDQWFVVHVLSGQENKVRDNIEKRVKTEEMSDVVYEVLVPTERVSEIKKGKKSETTLTSPNAPAVPQIKSQPVIATTNGPR